MSSFVTILIGQSFKKVTYYTVKFEDEQYSEFEKFILKHQSKANIKDEFQDLMSLIKRLGEKEGAKDYYFSRKERKAEALPPDWSSLPIQKRKLHVKYTENLRLYCMRITEEIVFLFNGGVKTPGPITAQECKVVRRYFELANQLAPKIEEALREGNLKINGLKLEFEKDFELMI